MTEGQPDPSDAPIRIGPGVFVAIVGPSGAGKDTLIALARESLAVRPNVVFARRVVTREAVPESEDHESLTETEFLRQAAAGAFAIEWRAHGLCYGLPASLDEAIKAGSVVVANVSRAILPRLCERYAAVIVALVTAHSEAIRHRLEARGREDGDAIDRRISRSTIELPYSGDCVVLDNTGPPELAAERLIALLTDAVGDASPLRLVGRG